MAVEVADSSFAIVENVSESNGSTDNKKVNITFGSHGVDEPVKVEVNNVAESNFPKDAVDEWPESKIHSFYVVRYRALEDQNLRAKLDLAEKELQKKNQARLQIVEKIKAKRADRAQVIAQLRSLGVENKQFRTIMDEKRREMEPLQQALGKLRGSGGGEKGPAICSSEEELNDIIKSLQYRIQHESIPLTEEKQILREIKQLEGTRPKVIANAAERARIQDSLGQKEAIQGQVKSIGVDLDGVRKEKQVINAKLKQLDEEKLVIEKDINVLEGELAAVTEKRDKTFETIKDMRKQREEGNSSFYQNRTLLTKAKALAANKEVDALKELSKTEVENFMSLWNTNKAFRADYEKRSLSALDMRQMSKDGRLRGPNEKPLVRNEVVAAPAVVQPKSEALPKPSATKQIPPKEEAMGPTDPPSEQKKAQKAMGRPKSDKDGNSKKKKEVGLEDAADEEEYGYFVGDKPKELGLGLGPKKEEVDEKKLKEQKREEEIAKRNQAEERKRKQAEKMAAKSAAKAQKEAEKKIKEREKRARKKAGSSAIALDSEEPVAEATEEVAEPEKIEEKIEAPQKNKDRKENTVRNRRPRPRGPDSLPKAILKRKKATNYWVWVGPAAAVAVILLLIVGYSYFS
ncbi:Proton pump-interactor 1 [Striga hermonthica]|uniref:Proton pump-interactor 1 n=1 Tax=Striga hermonthica TaxID=68872 RepID=A0A9N7MWM1_STRHE|nr:Proton pump-interactor 1 [Striga hermonthica]